MSGEHPAEPSSLKVALWFVVGILVGVAIGFPAIPDGVTLAPLFETGSVGSVLVAGILSLVVITAGMFALYQLFWFLDT